MKVTLKLRGIISASMGFSEKEIVSLEGVKLKDFIDSLHLPVNTNWIIISVNGTIVDRNKILEENDEVSIYPLGGGG